jgi:hypothetical protein
VIAGRLGRHQVAEVPVGPVGEEQR